MTVQPSAAMPALDSSSVAGLIGPLPNADVAQAVVERPGQGV
jgi:hypothetical protein